MLVTDPAEKETRQTSLEDGGQANAHGWGI